MLSLFLFKYFMILLIMLSFGGIMTFSATESAGRSICTEGLPAMVTVLDEEKLAVFIYGIDTGVILLEQFQLSFIFLRTLMLEVAALTAEDGGISFCGEPFSAPLTNFNKAHLIATFNTKAYKRTRLRVHFATKILSWWDMMGHHETQVVNYYLFPPPMTTLKVPEKGFPTNKHQILLLIA